MLGRASLADLLGMRFSRPYAPRQRMRGLAIVLGALSCTGEWSFPIPNEAGAIDSRFADVCTAWANAACDFADRCPYLVTAWADHTQCVWRTTLECQLVAADPGVDFDENAIRACAATDPSCAAGFPSLTECLPPGTLPDGSSCVWSESCQSKACGHLLDPETQAYAMCGTCWQATPPCTVTCPGGYICAADNDGGSTCRPPAALGESCREANCESGTCDPVSMLCVAGIALGASCDDSSCTDPNTYCDSTRHCAAQVAVPYGGACDSSGKVCIGGATCISTCKGPIPDGFACDPPDGSFIYLACLRPARCMANQCLYPSPALCPP